MLPGAETWATGPDVIWEVAGPGRQGEGLLVLSSSGPVHCRSLRVWLRRARLVLWGHDGVG